MIQIVILQLFLLLSGCIASVASVEKAESKSINKPNIIIILADDQGWGSTSVQMAENNPLSASDLYERQIWKALQKEESCFQMDTQLIPTVLLHGQVFKPEKHRLSYE